MALRSIVTVVAMMMFGVGCGTKDTDDTLETLEVIGSWASSWGTDIITADKWNTATIIEFDNETNTAITQLPADDEYNPSKFARMVWTEKTGDSFYYCTEALGKLTADEARTATEAAASGQLLH